MEISAGKWSQIKKEKESGQAVGGPKSLNKGYRKRETERIEQENHAFAKRLFGKQANLNKKKLDEEYKTHLRYKRQIQKIAPPNKKRSKAASTVRQSGVENKLKGIAKKKETAKSDDEAEVEEEEEQKEDGADGDVLVGEGEVAKQNEENKEDEK